jgi:hypothetical protein
MNPSETKPLPSETPLPLDPMATFGAFKIVKARSAQRDATEGFVVVYPDGYTSWCPAKQFLAANVCLDVRPDNRIHAEFLRFFEFGHLPEFLQEISAPFKVLAYKLVTQKGACPVETQVALRKLLEAKDCAVRAALPR